MRRLREWLAAHAVECCAARDPDTGECLNIDGNGDGMPDPDAFCDSDGDGLVGGPGPFDLDGDCDFDASSPYPDRSVSTTGWWTPTAMPCSTWISTGTWPSPTGRLFLAGLLTGDERTSSHSQGTQAPFGGAPRPCPYRFGLYPDRGRAWCWACSALIVLAVADFFANQLSLQQAVRPARGMPCATWNRSSMPPIRWRESEFALLAMAEQRFFRRHRNPSGRRLPGPVAV